MEPIKKLLTLIVMLAAMLVFAGCNTMEGFGKDMEEAGEEIQEEADD